MGIGWVRGQFPIEHPDFGKLFRCPECGRGKRAARLKGFSRLRGDLATCELAQWKALPGVGRVLPDLTGYLLRSGKGDDTQSHGWITMSGPNGTGKSHLLAALVNHFVTAERPAIYTTMQEMLQDLRSAYDPKSEHTYSQLWNDIVTADVLAIDEIDKFAGTAWAQEQVFAMLGRRYDEGDRLLTVLATNVDCRSERFRILPPGPFPSGYLESRICDTRNLLLTDFWKGFDARAVGDMIENA